MKLVHFEAAKEAFDKELVNFFRDAPQGPLVEKMIQGGKMVQQKISREVEKAVAGIDLDQLATKVYDKLLATTKSKNTSGKKLAS